jgi:hypothetical protein
MVRHAPILAAAAALLVVGVHSHAQEPLPVQVQTRQGPGRAVLNRRLSVLHARTRLFLSR